MDTLIEMAKRAAYFKEMELKVLLESYDEEKDIITRQSADWIWPSNDLDPGGGAGNRHKFRAPWHGGGTWRIPPPGYLLVF